MVCSMLLARPLGLCKVGLCKLPASSVRRATLVLESNHQLPVKIGRNLISTQGGVIGLVQCNRNREHKLNQRVFFPKQEQRFVAECAGFLRHRKQGYALKPFAGSGKEEAYSARSLHASRREESASAVQKKVEKGHSLPEDGPAGPLIQRVRVEKGFTSSEAEVPLTRKVRVERGFTSSEDGPSTSGRTFDESASKASFRKSRKANGSEELLSDRPKGSAFKRKASAKSRTSSAERSAVYEMLEGRGKAPKKSLGQNFVIDANVIQNVVTAAGIGPGDIVLEIGPGTGNLTKALAAAGAAKIVAVEKDGELAEMLSASWEGLDQVQVETADILHWPIEARIRPLLPPGKRAKCVANLPYNITTSTLKKLLPLGSLFASCTLMLQEEAAERLVNAAPGDSEYRAMSFFVNFYAEPRIAFKVNKSAFTPQPKCDSAVVVMGMRTPNQWQVASPQAFFWLVNVAFAGRRKMLRNSLQASQHDSGAISQALEELGLDVKARPEQLSLSDFLALFRKLEAKSIEGKVLPPSKDVLNASEVA